MQRYLLFIFFLCIFHSKPSWAREQAGDPGVLSKHMYFGDCTLQRDPLGGNGPGDLWWLTCLKLRVGSEIAFVSGYPERNFSLNYGDVFGSISVNEYISIQSHGILRDVRPLGDETVEDQNRYTDYSVLRLGNPALHRWRITTGVMRLPFGLDFSPAGEFYKFFENRIYWDSPRYGAMISIDDMASAQLDLGVGSTDYFGFIKKKSDDEDLKDEPNEEEESYEAYSARFSYDISALDGFRMIASGYGETTGIRRYGVAMLSVSPARDVTSFEFIRRRLSPDNQAGDFQQIIRLAHLSAFRSGNRWLLQIDDERFRHRFGTIGYDTLMWNHANLRMAVSYLKSEIGDNVKLWIISTGLELIL